MWDTRLIKGLYMMEAFDIEGHPIWVEESPSITFEAKKRKIRSLAAVEAAQETHSKKKNPEKGVRFVAVARLKKDAKWPTRADWLEKHSKKKADMAPDSDASAKIAAMKKYQEEKAARKVSEVLPTVD